MKYLRDRRGNFGLIAALMAFPIMLAAGTAVDFGHLQASKAQLDSAADAAVLSALSPASPVFEKAVLMASDGDVEGAEELMKHVLKANIAIGFKFDDLQIDPKLTKTGDTLYSKIEYSAKVDMQFGGFIGTRTRTIHGLVRAQTAISSPIDFYMLLDNTPSMGVGASAADIQTLVDNTPDKCAFACHQMDRTDNYYALAKSLGVEMRIDVVRKATQKLTETAKAIRQSTDQFRMAVYSFGASAQTMGFTELAPLSNDLDLVKSKTSALDLMTIPYQNYNFDQLTAFDETLKAARMSIPEKGPDHGDRRQILFFVSDGVADAYKPVGCKKLMTGSRCQEPIDTKFCDQLKKRDVEIAVLYTAYLPLPNNSWYNTWIRPFSGEISPAMRECASPGLFFEVSPTGGIEEAMEALLIKAISTPRLTN